MSDCSASTAPLASPALACNPRTGLQPARLTPPALPPPPSSQLPHLKELRFTSGQALPDALAALLPPGCTFSTAGLPREGPATDCWGRSLHQTAPVSAWWCGWLGVAACGGACDPHRPQSGDVLSCPANS